MKALVSTTKELCWERGTAGGMEGGSRIKDLWEISRIKTVHSGIEINLEITFFLMQGLSLYTCIAVSKKFT